MFSELEGLYLLLKKWLCHTRVCSLAAHTICSILLLFGIFIVVVRGITFCRRGTLPLLLGQGQLELAFILLYTFYLATYWHMQRIGRLTRAILSSADISAFSSQNMAE
jgi:hypothetical protein